MDEKLKIYSERNYQMLIDNNLLDKFSLIHKKHQEIQNRDNLSVSDVGNIKFKSILIIMANYNSILFELTKSELNLDAITSHINDCINEIEKIG